MQLSETIFFFIFSLNDENRNKEGNLKGTVVNPYAERPIQRQD